MKNEDNYPGLVPLDDEVPAAETPTYTFVIKEGPQGVDLRELHRELESKQEFANWSKVKLRGFTELVDYKPADEIVARPQGGSYNKKGFFVSVDCAKHIALMENTDRGQQVRGYFIEREKALRALGPTTYIEACRAHLVSLEKNEEQALLLEVQRRGIPE